MKKTLALGLGILFLVFAISGLGFAKGKKPWKVPGHFATIQAAIDSANVVDGDVILVGPGFFAGAFVTKAVTIKGIGNAVINFGPLHSSGMVQGFRFLSGGSGASILNLRFEVDLAIMNGASVNDITVSQCAFMNCVQGVSNWGGTGWEITHNEIIDLRTRTGGGIGILVADRAGNPAGVNDNIISHNAISGTLHVSSYPSEGGYNGSGIVLYADFRYGWPGAVEIAHNKIAKNTISMISDTPGVVDIAAIELTDTRDDSTILPPVLHDNAVGFNDLRGTVLQIVLTPAILDQYNNISRNFGENRGHGLHPKVFK